VTKPHPVLAKKRKDKDRAPGERRAHHGDTEARRKAGDFTKIFKRRAQTKVEESAEKILSHRG
jgi:hypothetical protein